MGAKTRSAGISGRQAEVEGVLRERLAARLVAEREARGWTQEALAERAGVHWTTIGKIERGLQTPSLAFLVVVAEAMDLKVGTLIGVVLNESRGDDNSLLDVVKGLSSKEQDALRPVLEALVTWKQS
jgi:transcriptional regulator with XRE-family HTH domain